MYSVVASEKDCVVFFRPKYRRIMHQQWLGLHWWRLHWMQYMRSINTSGALHSNMYWLPRTHTAPFDVHANAFNWIHEIQKQDASECVRVFVRFIPLFVVNQYGCCSYANWKGSPILAHAHLHRHNSMSLLIVCVLLFFCVLLLMFGIVFCIWHMRTNDDLTAYNDTSNSLYWRAAVTKPNIFLVLRYPVGNSACILVTFLHMIFLHWSEWGCRSVEFSWIQIH